MAEKTKQQYPLKTPEDISAAYERLYNRQLNGEVDAKSVDGMNTTLKGSTYLNVKLKMDYLKMFLTAAIKKVDMPAEVLKELGLSSQVQISDKR